MRLTKGIKLYALLFILLFNFLLINLSSSKVLALPVDPCAPYGCTYNGPCPGQSNEQEPTCCLYVIWSKSPACGMWRTVMEVQQSYPQSTRYCNYWN